MILRYKEKTSSSIVDGLENAESIGGISKEEFYQLSFCCKSSHLLNEISEPIDLNEYNVIIKTD